MVRIAGRKRENSEQQAQAALKASQLRARSSGSLMIGHAAPYYGFTLYAIVTRLRPLCFERYNA